MMHDHKEGRLTMADATNIPELMTPRVLVRGLANAGKTTRALDRVASLVAAGEDPSSILLITSVPVPKGPGASGADSLVTTLTPRELELGLLSSDVARAITGRRARVLTQFEETFLLEDMRTTGLPARRLKGMLGFFRRSITELADDDMSTLIIDPREQAVFDALHAHLGAYDAMLDCEVSNLCVNYLRLCPEAAASLGVRHLVVDDYQELNRASQIVLEMLVPATLWAFADPTHAAQGSDPFPYPKGIEEFLARNPDAAVVDLPVPAATRGARAAAATLAESGFISTLSVGLVEQRGKVEEAQSYDVPALADPLAGVEELAWGAPADEFAGVARLVLDALEEGERPSEVLVAVPNRSWERGVRDALGRLGVVSQALGARQEIGGDLRELDRCATGRMYVALALLADPGDSLAWRCWCGCGDYLARSSVFSKVEELSRARDVTLAGALALVERGDADPIPAQDGLLEAYRQGRLMIDSLSSLRGADLLAGLAHGLGLSEVPAFFARLLDEPGADGGASPEPDAATLFARAYRRATLPTLGGDEAGVRVCDYGRLAGLKARRVVVAGLMNGWLPGHAYFDLAEADFDKRQQMDLDARAAMYEMAGCATQSLALSGFETCDLELAERLGLKGYRVSMGPDGRRVTTCRTSDIGRYAMAAWGHGGLERLEVPGLQSRPVARAAAMAQR